MKRKRLRQVVRRPINLESEAAMLSAYFMCHNAAIFLRDRGFPWIRTLLTLTDVWAPTVHKLCHNQAFVDYVMHSSFAYRQFNSNLTCGDLTILPYELIRSRNSGTVGHNVRLPEAARKKKTGPGEKLTCEALKKFRSKE
ncbi:hypothetical protein AVEN_250866-1 [Araneus ventricosus]|uniref:Uncharacterized protein n=1 Tax=Araneus ventricosus TaxID=182803 RepID=A0A4Y2INN7_ARAVE|nr:hypothetical protein AVEN_250866-1 [Araneus ventricosus]